MSLFVFLTEGELCIINNMNKYSWLLLFSTVVTYIVAKNTELMNTPLLLGEIWG